MMIYDSILSSWIIYDIYIYMIHPGSYIINHIWYIYIYKNIYGIVFTISPWYSPMQYTIYLYIYIDTHPHILSNHAVKSGAAGSATDSGSSAVEYGITARCVMMRRIYVKIIYMMVVNWPWVIIKGIIGWCNQIYGHDGKVHGENQWFLNYHHIYLYL